MKFQIKERLTPEEIEAGLRVTLKDSVTSSIMNTLTGGVFLVAFALKLGASNAVIGLLVAMMPLAQLLQLPSIVLVEKWGNRRAITVGSSLLSRLPWLFVAALPFLFSSSAQILPFLVLAVAIYSFFSAASNCSWNSWLRDLVPQKRLGDYFAKRMSLVMASGLIMSLLGGLFLDLWAHAFPGSELSAYAFLFGAGAVAGLVGVRFLSLIPEPRLNSSPVKSLSAHLARPFRDVNFKSLLFFQGSWSFAVSLATPFFTVYMLKQLQLGMSLVIGLTVLSQIAHLKSLPIWGVLSDRFTNKSILALSAPLYLICILAWTFTTMPQKHFLTIPLLILLHLLMGVSMAGITLGCGNIGFKLAPPDQATSYLAAKNFINSLAEGVAPLLGGVFVATFATRELSWTLKWASPTGEMAIETLNFQGFDFFFFLAFLIGLFSLSRLALVREEGEKGGGISELISLMRQRSRSRPAESTKEDSAITDPSL